jgi:hypothetical protein
VTNEAMKDTRGAVVLTVVMVIALVVGVAAFAYHDLWRGSARTLFSVQEHRELLNLGRSALSEAYFRLQGDLDRSKQEWFVWCTRRQAPVMSFDPKRTIAAAKNMSADPTALAYTIEDAGQGSERVKLERVIGVRADASGDEMGIVDLTVALKVRRSTTSHVANLTMTERRNFWLADDTGPFGGGGRHVELSPTPVMTSIGGE